MQPDDSRSRSDDSPDSPAVAEVVMTSGMQYDGLTLPGRIHVTLTDPDVVGSADASAEFTAATAALAALVEGYEHTLRAHGLDASSTSVEEAARALNDAILRLAVAHTRLTGMSFAQVREEISPWEEFSDDHGEEAIESDEDFGPAPITTVPPTTELPVWVAAGTVLARGHWGAVSQRDLLVYRDGVVIEIDWILRRNGATFDEWQQAWTVFDWFPGPGTENAVPMSSGPEGFTVLDHGGGGERGAGYLSGNRSVWVTPLPTSDIEVLVALAIAGLEPLSVTIPADVVQEAATRVAVIETDRAHDGARGVARR